ncbi:tagaturonate reductase [Miniimonas arenae]|uniref:Tagaturonate reductase n=1 Tax=Miniimonas arenae TaxID=676201 RepID=A0A5C5BDN4_9MICO|nr:tagaturonate reductase [Miniimonas arenae]TNU76005.1 tagaturonate reductase [Miniimonas arenae]
MSTSTLPRPGAAADGREPLPITILQFGAGNFLRAFVDLMVQQANDAGVLHDAVAAVQSTPWPDPALAHLEAQDGIYHVLLEGVRDGAPVREFTRVTAVQRIVRAHEDFEAYRALYLSPELRTIVSNTTEAGIAWVPGDDLTATPPLSFPAKITALLLDRFRHFDGDPAAGLHVVCCELIEDNATTLREYVLGHAAENALPEAFTQWVRTACTFHDTLVDRIVPGFPREEIDAIHAELGVADLSVVKGEYFGLWVIGGDPVIRDVLPLDRAGLPVEFVPDVRPVREKKVRILNGLHTAMSAVGLLLGATSVREADARPDVAAYLRALLEREVLPTIPGDPDALRAFAASIVERFANPYLHHLLGDIALNALSKYRARNLPVLLDGWAAGREAPRTAFALAALLVLDSGRLGPEDFTPRDDAEPLAVVRDTFDAHDVEAWVRRSVLAAAYLEPGDARLDRLVREVTGHARALLAVGPEAALAALVDG